MKYKNKTITNTFGKTMYQTYSEAERYCVEELGWDQDEILERRQHIQVVLDGYVTSIVVNSLVVDPGSDDYIYFLNY